jgi:two-component system, NtrC family, sensor kinase
MRNDRPDGPSSQPRAATAVDLRDTGERVTVSSIPISNEMKTASRSVHLDVPARWLDTLLDTANALPIDQGEGAVMRTIVDTIVAILPDHGVGACLVDGSGRPQEQTVYKVCPTGEELRGVGVDPTRLFPGYAYERVYDVEGNGTGSTLHIASDDPAINDENASANVFVMRTAQVFRRGLEVARAHARSTEQAQELQALNSHMVQAEKLASLGQIAAGVVHELNNPLTSIVAYTDYLTRRAQQKGTDGDELERLRRIGESAGRMLRFTRDLVTYARPSSETPVSVSLHIVIDQALAFCEHVLDEAGAKVERRYAPELPVVHGMPEQLAQVFVNLVTNACHAMPKGSGRLVVSTTASTDGAWVNIVVEDNGHGITDDHLPHIFAPFFTTKTDGRGTGLGLSIVKNILDNHDAVIRAECVHPSGTRFVLTIPTRR